MARDGDSEAGKQSADTAIRDTARDALSNLVSVLQLTDDGRVRCSEKTRRPSAASVKLVDDELVAGDFYDDEPIAAYAWPLLLQAGGLAQLAGSRLEPTTRGRAVLAKPSYEALGALWAKWLTKAPIDEFSRIEAIKGQRKSATLTAPGRRRAAAADGLAALPTARWVPIEDVFKILRRRPELKIARSDRAMWNLYLEDPQYGSLGYAGYGEWEILEGRYSLCLIFEYAATLGLVDVAYTDPDGARADYHDNWGAEEYAALSRYDGLTAVRINELGDAVLHHHPTSTLALPVPKPATLMQSEAKTSKPALAKARSSTAAGPAIEPPARGQDPDSSRAAADRAIIAALADPAALRVFAAIISMAGPGQPGHDRTGAISYHYVTAAGIAKTTGLARGVVTVAAERLLAAGLATSDGNPDCGWRIQPAAFGAT